MGLQLKDQAEVTCHHADEADEAYERGQCRLDP